MLLLLLKRNDLNDTITRQQLRRHLTKQKCFDILNRLGKDHECDGRTDGREAQSTGQPPALKCELIGSTESN